ncbi:MAG: ArsI/CadI family heavy metal resistance metalloenzyme [Kiloniellaceae bacterium]
MKRLHLHLAVADLAQSVRFYSTLFDAPPTVEKADYAKWMLEDPRVNFAISQRGAAPGIEHLGIQVETPEELRAVYARLQQAEGPVLEEGATTCCYAQSEKAWISDPQGVSWEAFLTLGDSTVYGREPDLAAAAGGVCCTPDTPQGVCCPPKAELPAEAPCCGEAR